MKTSLLGLKARQKLQEGINLCADFVVPTMGKHGENVTIYNGIRIDSVKDGVTIAKAIEEEDEEIQAGVVLAQQCASQTDIDAGDGTTTTIALLRAFTNEIVQEYETKNSRVLRDELREATDKLFSKIKPKKLKTREEMYNLAYTSSLDKESANILADAFHKFGKNTRVVLEESESHGLTSETVSGLQVSTRLANEKILKSLTEDKVVLENVSVLAINSIDSHEKIKEKLDEIPDPSQLVVIANSFDRSTLIGMINAPVKFYPVENLDINGFDDIIEFTKNPLKVVIERECTTFIGGSVSKEYLKAIEKNAKTHYEKELAEKRIASLSAGVLSIHVGGNTPVERNERLLQIEDSSNALKKAMEYGYVEGGGWAIAKAGLKLSEKGSEGIVRRVSQTIVDILGMPEDESVIDSFKSVQSSFYNALADANSLNTSAGALIKKREKNED